MKIDWTGCPDVETKPDVQSGHPVVRGTRILAEDVLEHSAVYTPEQIVAEVFPSLPLDRARRIISFARLHVSALG